MKKNIRQAAGFSIIEFLVCIVIVAILYAILLPVFAQVRESGRATVCVSNLHQIGVAVQLYVSDNDELFPPMNASNGNPANPLTHVDLPMVLLDGGYALGHNRFNQGGLFLCPSYAEYPDMPDNLDAQGVATKRLPRSYGFHRYLFPDRKWYGNLDAKPEDVALADITAPAQLIMAAEMGSAGENWWYGFFMSDKWYWAGDGPLTNDRDIPYSPGKGGGAPGYTIRYRHNGGANVLYADGHVSKKMKGAKSSISWQQEIYDPKLYASHPEGGRP